MNDPEFEQELSSRLAAIGCEKLAYDAERAESCAELYKYVEDHARSRQLINTMVALPVMRSKLMAPESSAVHYRKDRSELEPQYRHALSVGRMLIDLNAPLMPFEEDLALAAAVCHVLINTVECANLYRELTEYCGLDSRIYDIIELNDKKEQMSDAEMEAFYDRIRENKLALLVKLADRGNLVEQLYYLPAARARDRIRETRTYFFPMCIFAKEQFPELITAVGILMEKMRCLIEVADIFSVKYEEREAGLVSEILAMQEENAGIRGILARLREGI